MNVKELKELLNTYPEDTLVGVHSYYENRGSEMLELADGLSEGFTDETDQPVVYIF